MLGSGWYKLYHAEVLTCVHWNQQLCLVSTMSLPRVFIFRAYISLMYWTWCCLSIKMTLKIDIHIKDDLEWIRVYPKLDTFLNKSKNAALYVIIVPYIFAFICKHGSSKQLYSTYHCRLYLNNLITYDIFLIIIFRIFGKR